LVRRDPAGIEGYEHGNTDDEIARAQGWRGTVKTHLGQLFSKLGVTSRTEALEAATRRGLVRLE
jgi:DNA-binding NarL/FixJ family response regulator